MTKKKKKKKIKPQGLKESWFKQVCLKGDLVGFVVDEMSQG